jgi:hypothetical protein
MGWMSSGARAAVPRAGFPVGAPCLALLALLACPVAPAGAQVEPLVLRLSDAIGTPGGTTTLVLRTYASRPVRRGRVRVRVPPPPAGSVLATSPIASWDGGYLLDVSGARVATLVPNPDGFGVDLDFLVNPDFVFNRRDGVVAVIFVTLDAALIPGDRYDLLGDGQNSELFDPEDDPVLIQLVPGQVRVRAPGDPYQLEAGTVGVQPGSGATVEVGTSEPFAIGSGTLVLDYDPAILQPGTVPTVTADPRNGLVALTVDTSTAGVLTIGLSSPDGTWNSEVPGQLLRIDFPISAGVSLGTSSPLVFDAASQLFPPSGSTPLPMIFENGGFDFVLVPDVFADNFEIGDTGWWQLGPP